MASSKAQSKGSLRLGVYLRRLREGYHYTLRRVEERSERLGDPIDNSQLSRFEKGKAIPSFDKLRTLSRVFNVPVQQFSDILDLEKYDHLKPSSRDFDVLMADGQREFTEGNYGAAFVVFERCLEVEEEVGAGESRVAPESAERRAMARLYMAYALKGMGKLAMAEVELRAILRSGRRLGRTSRLRAVTLLSYCYRERGDGYLASVLAREALELASEDGDLAVQIGILNTLGILAYDDGSLRRASEYFDRALRLAERIPGQEEKQVTAAIHLGGCLAALGRSESGISRIRAAIQTARERGYRRSTALGLTRLAEIEIEQNRGQKAVQYLQQSDHVASNHDEPYNDILFLNAYRFWELARSNGNSIQERMALGRLKHYRSFIESRFPEVESFDAYVEGRRRRS